MPIKRHSLHAARTKQTLLQNIGCIVSTLVHGSTFWTPTKTLALLEVARKAGPSIGTVRAHLLETDGVLAPRSIFRILSLARKHGSALTEDAEHFALEAGAPSYRFLRRYLERVKAPAAALRQIDPIIHQLTDSRDLTAVREAAS